MKLRIEPDVRPVVTSALALSGAVGVFALAFGVLAVGAGANDGGAARRPPVAGAAGAGAGLLPDLLEPADSPNHRLFFHSLAAAGIVGWVGLVVPHLARFLVGPSFVRLLPACACLGGGFLLCIDTLARTLAPVEIPLGILTALVGSPFFIVLLRRSQAGWG